MWRTTRFCKCSADLLTVFVLFFSFFSVAAAFTKHQIGQNYTTLSMSSISYNKLGKRCIRIVENYALTLSPIAQKMLKKLEYYLPLMTPELTGLVPKVDPRFTNDYFHDSDVLQPHVMLMVKDVLMSPSSLFFWKRPPLNELMDDRSTDAPVDDEIVRFLRATSAGDVNVEPLQWWQNNEGRFPHVGAVANDNLAIRSSSVASESRLSCSENLVSDHRCHSKDDILSACIRSRSWTTLLGI